jgi:ubiquinone biosynthesis protein Coq4
MKKITIDYSAETTLRGKLLLWLLEKGTPLHARLNPHRIAWNLSPRELLQFSEGTLGNSLGQFYQKEKFEPIPKAERHDVFHVLLGYSTGVTDEAAMQFFLWGNGKPSFFTVGTCLLTLLFFPFQFPVFREAYRKGKRSAPLRDWNFRQLLGENITALQQRLFTQNFPI